MPRWTRCALATLLAAVGGASVAREPAPARALAALRGITPAQAAALGEPSARAAVSESLRTAGRPGDASLPELIEAARVEAMGGGAWQEPTVSVGPYELSVPDLLRVVGPREGRDRHAVAARLRLVAPEASRGLTTGAIVALVPDLVAAAEQADVTRVLERLRLALATAEAPQ